MSTSLFSNFPKYIYLFFILLIFAGFFSGCEKAKEYTTIQPKNEEIMQIIEVDGVVESHMQTDLTFQRSGKISTILVAENQEVKSGDVLATINSDRLQIEVQRSVASLNMVKAQLSLKHASPTNESIDVSYSQVEDAELSLTHASKKLQETRASNRQKIIIAEQEVKNVETKQKNAEVTYKNTTDLGGVDTTKAQKSLADSLEKSRKQSVSTMDSIRDSISLATSIIDPENSAGKEQQTYIGFHSSQKLPTKDAYNRLVSDFSTTESLVANAMTDWNESSIQETLEVLGKRGVETKKLLDSLYELMETSVTNTHLTVAEVDAFKSQITAQQSALINQMAGIRDLEYSIKDANIGITRNDISALSQSDTASSSLDDVNNNLILAQKNRENTKIQATSSEQTIIREVETKELSLKKAKANHKQLLAKPRNVDIAQLRANVSQQQASVRQAQKDVEDTKIIAPFDGVITKINFDIGENITSSQVTIVMMTKDLEIVANIPEIDITKIKKGDSVKIQLDSLGEKKILIGNIEDIDNFETDIQGTNYYQATIAINKEEEKEGEEKNPSYYSEIKSGMSGDVFITQSNKYTALLIPQSSIEYEAGKYFVSLLQDEKPVKTAVKIGMRTGDQVEILSGVSENDTLVIFTK